MSSSPKRVREQAVVYLGQRDRALLENLAKETGLSRTELFRRGLWALAAQTFGGKQSSALEYLIANASDADLPPDYSERADDYLYGDGSNARVVHEGESEKQDTEPPPAPRKRKADKRARPR
ncbi:MAG TPA: hypothetical protein VGH04_15275 [Gemmatimonadaceae bacterium]|jgi:hypothetical protein